MTRGCWGGGSSAARRGGSRRSWIGRRRSLPGVGSPGWWWPVSQPGTGGKVVLQAARGRGLAMVCVQPMLVARAREAEDYTGNKSDYGDAVIIARLVAELRCYIPYLPAGPWARLRHLGVRRAQLLDRVTAARQDVAGDGEAGPVGVGASGGDGGVGDGDPQGLVDGEQGVDLLGDAGQGARAQD